MIDKIHQSIILLLFLGLPLLVVYLVYAIVVSDKDCRRRGGVPSRAGCLTKESFVR
jgi:hypothetical protein